MAMLSVAFFFTLMVRTIAGAYLGFRPFDDTFITFRYAKNLMAGNGFVYNLGEKVLGTTTPLWTLTLAGAGSSNVELGSAAMILGLTADLVSAVLIVRILFRLTSSWTVAFGAAVLFLCLFDGLSITRSGMETPLFNLLVLGALHQMVDNHHAAAGALAGFATLTRPEGLFLLLPLIITTVTSPADSKLRKLFAVLGFYLLILAAWAVFSFFYFGSIVPQSVVAKAQHVAQDPSLRTFSRMNLRLFALIGQFGGAIFERTWLQLNFLLTGLSGVAALGLVNRALRQRSRQAALALVTLAAFPALYVAALAAGNAFTWFPWYYGPIYPFLAMLAVLGLAELKWWRPRGPWRFPADLTVVLGVSVLVLAQVVSAVTIKLPGCGSFGTAVSPTGSAL